MPRTRAFPAASLQARAFDKAKIALCVLSKWFFSSLAVMKVRTVHAISVIVIQTKCSLGFSFAKCRAKFAGKCYSGSILKNARQATGVFTCKLSEQLYLKRLAHDGRVW